MNTETYFITPEVNNIQVLPLSDEVKAKFNYLYKTGVIRWDLDKQVFINDAGNFELN